MPWMFAEAKTCEDDTQPSRCDAATSEDTSLDPERSVGGAGVYMRGSENDDELKET